MWVLCPCGRAWVVWPCVGMWQYVHTHDDVFSSFLLFVSVCIVLNAVCMASFAFAVSVCMRKCLCGCVRIPVLLMKFRFAMPSPPTHAHMATYTYKHVTKKSSIILNMYNKGTYARTVNKAHCIAVEALHKHMLTEPYIDAHPPPPPPRPRICLCACISVCQLCLCVICLWACVQNTRHASKYL